MRFKQQNDFYKLYYRLIREIWITLLVELRIIKNFQREINKRYVIKSDGREVFYPPWMEYALILEYRILIKRRMNVRNKIAYIDNKMYWTWTQTI